MYTIIRTTSITPNPNSSIMHPFMTRVRFGTYTTTTPHPSRTTLGTGTPFIITVITTHPISRNVRIRTSIITPADEDMGYLPGEMERKMEPWAKPMMEIMENYLTHNQINARTYIEPLGFMRGRTFTNSFIIADEMQNSTPNQMKMLLTRVGENTKLVVTGDTSQSDLGEENGH